MPTEGDDLSALLSGFGSTASGITLLRLANGITMIGPPVDGVAVFLVLSGTMLLEIEGEPARKLRPGRLALVPAGRRVQVACTPGNTQLIDGRKSLTRQNDWPVADATRGREANLVVSAGRIAGTGVEALSTIVVVAITKHPSGKPLFRLLRDATLHGGAGQSALGNSLMNACVVLGLRRAIERAPGDEPFNAVRPGLISRAVAAMRTRPGEPHSVGSLAGVAGMSRSTFVRQFSRLMRSSPAEYLKRVRLDEARAMLENTELPIKTIAARVGFASRSHFSREFRATFGVDPTQYRQSSG